MHAAAHSFLHHGAARLVARKDTELTPSQPLEPRAVGNSTVDNTDPFRFSTGLNGVDQEGNYLWVHVLLVTFVGMVVLTFALRIVKMGSAHIRHIYGMGNPTRQAFWASNSTGWWPWLKRHLLYAPLWRNRHNREIQISRVVNVGTLPSRFHAILLLVYVASNLAYCLALPWDRPDGYSVAAALRGRTGTLAALNLVPTVLFALRNNPLIPILQVSYDTFNLLHRWAARLVIIESVAHTLCWLVNSVNAGGWNRMEEMLSDSPSYQWGMVGTVAFMLISIQAWSPVRHAFYETFVASHRFMVLVGIIGVYLHVDLHSLPQVPWVQIVFAMWSLEWLLRIARIVYYNVSARSVTRVKVEALPGEACRVTFNLVRPWTARPGAHVHVYLPTLSFWSSHPFSVAWTEPDEDEHLSEKLPTTEPKTSVVAARRRLTTRQISLVIRAREGFTRKLYNKAKNSDKYTFTTFGAIEGPYAGHDSLASYGTAVLFAGGVGITHQVNYIRQLVGGYAEGTVATRKVVLVWSIPTTECLSWVKPWMDEILAMPRRKEVLRIMLFITKPKSNVEVNSVSETVQMFPGRCPVHTILDREIDNREGALAVTVCGPGAFADSVRGVVRQRVERGVVDFIEEAFTY